MEKTYMTPGQPNDPDFRMLSDAVQAWYRFYELPPADPASHTLCNAAIALFNEGYRTVDEIATALIGAYVGFVATRTNAPTSMSLH